MFLGIDKQGAPYHCLVPDNGHPFLYPVDALRDQSEVVLAHRLLGCAVGTVAAACDLQVSAARTKKSGDQP